MKAICYCIKKFILWLFPNANANGWPKHFLKITQIVTFICCESPFGLSMNLIHIHPQSQRSALSLQFSLSLARCCTWIYIINNYHYLFFNEQFCPLIFNHSLFWAVKTCLRNWKTTGQNFWKVRLMLIEMLFLFQNSITKVVKVKIQPGDDYSITLRIRQKTAEM